MAKPSDLIGVHARLQPGRLAARELSSGDQWSYAELDDLVARLAGELVARGAVPGDRIAVLARNSVLQVALHFACGRAGFIYAPLNWRLGVAEIALLLELAEPRLLFADERSADLLNGTPFIPLSDVEQSAAGRAPFDGPMLDPDHPSLLLFTSGTSGKPKGVILTERNLHETAVNFGMLTRIGFDSVFLCDAPMFHVIGLVTNIRPVMTQGGAIAVSDGFEVARTLARLSDPALGITHYVGVPQMIAALRQQPGFDFSALRGMTALVSGGAPHPPEDILAWIADGVPIVLGFGMSEAGTVFGMSVDLDVIGRKPGSAGLATPMVETRIVDLEGRDVAPGQPGELLLRGENVSPGYWRNPEETARTRDAEGWFATGDIARCDEDGFFWIVDRRKDMFISGGENIYPAEIEALLDKYSGIAQCAVVGMPDARWGEVGHLVIVAHADGSVDETALLEFLGTRLARYKLPKRVTFAQALPKTATGKLQKAVLREQLLKAGH